MNIPARVRRVFLSVRALPENVRSTIVIIVLSLAAALSAVAFMTIMNRVYEFFFVSIHLSPLKFVLFSFCVVMGSSLVVSLLLKAAPDAAGSGIPQTKAVYWKGLGFMRWRPVLVKFVAGIVSIGGGASLGREGPTVYLGSGVASMLSGLLGSGKRERRGPAAMGAASGLAAAFNTPMAAITFILEELVGDLSTRNLGPVVLASLIGALTVHALMGNQPAFILPMISATSWNHLLLVPVVGALAAYAGVLFQRGSLHIRSRLKKQQTIPAWLLPCFGGFFTWIIGCAAFLGTGRVGVFGLGYLDLSAALHSNVLWWTAGILVCAKLAATIISYGFGGCGGIFSPTLFIGGMAGTFVAGLASIWLPLTPSDHIVLAAVGMSACMGGVIRAPLTSTLIVFEMTHQFEIVPGLMLGTLVAQTVVRLWGGKHNFYDALLLQDGHELIKIKPPRDLLSWQDLPVVHVMNAKPVIVSSLDPAALKKLVESTPYHRFPYIDGTAAMGIVTREAIRACLTEGNEPKIEKVGKCYAEATLKEAGNHFLESPSGIILVLNKTDNSLAGIVTLHDLLRAQAAVIE